MQSLILRKDICDYMCYNITVKQLKKEYGVE